MHRDAVLYTTENRAGEVVHDGEASIDVAAEIVVDLAGNDQASVRRDVGVFQYDVTGVIRGKLRKR